MNCNTGFNMYEEAFWCLEPSQVPFAKQAVADRIRETAASHGAIAGEVKWDIMEPTDEGCPPIPDWVPAQADPRLIVGAALPLSVGGASFLADLAPAELAHLRKVTRTIAVKEKRGGLTYEQADEVIMACGPKAAEAMLAQSIKRGS